MTKITDSTPKTTPTVKRVKRNVIKTQIVELLSVEGIRIILPVLGGSLTCAETKAQPTSLFIAQTNIISGTRATKVIPLS